MGITDLQIRKLKSRENRYDVNIGDGLVIRVTPSGEKAFFFRYSFQGKRNMVMLGAFCLPDFGLAKARTRHGEAMLDVKRGIDPGAKAQAEKAATKAAPTFKDLLDEFCEKELSKSPSYLERKRLVDKDVLPKWKDKKLMALTRRDAVLLLDEVRERAPVTANRLTGVLSRMFNFAADKGIIPVSPIVGLRRGKEESRSRVLTDAEIKTLWACLDLDRADIDIWKPSKLALKAILLTGQRPGEVTGMSRDEIQGDVWIIPPERCKTKEGNRVPITPMLADLIEQARPYNSGSKFIFVSPRSPLYQHKRQEEAKPKESDIPISVGALANAIRRHRQEMGIEPFTPHDLRRTLRTRLAEIGISDVIAERVLGHKLQGVIAIYNRHGYDTEKRQALTLWEGRLKEIIGQPETPQNVVQIGSRRRKG